ncbi:acyltransferase family protein [Arcticibacter eurypsychrophilus]|uniref:acyltransferase family protein n=1 Tax=Arcticibacter eurypsychrophilus TaxID=1434752 RepID=UPI00084D8D13|nr:DUF5009 domain-containing protein [Arcticibacter eurypsychrophilus]
MKNQQDRMVSLDVMRGIIMLLLAAESCQLYVSLQNLHLTGVTGGLINQFFHHRWHGLRFWDLVQPAFMTMAGTALFISYQRKEMKGISWNANLKHILLRCLRLFVLGIALHCVYAGKLVFELWNVLTQLAFTTLIAYLIIQQSFFRQFLFSILLLLTTELLYRFINIPGFNQPFTEGHNFGSYTDMLLMGKINEDGWVAINIIPTAAHTIWGVLAGKWLYSERSKKNKLQGLVFAGIVLLFAGMALDLSSLTPIIKRISTSSFVFASGGWVLLILAAFYWLVDLCRQQKFAHLFSAAGMNALFIYLFFETVGMQWLNPTVFIFIDGFLSFAGLSSSFIAVVSAFTVLVLEWLLCIWLYRNKLFFKI